MPCAGVNIRCARRARVRVIRLSILGMVSRTHVPSGATRCLATGQPRISDCRQCVPQQETDRRASCRCAGSAAVSTSPRSRSIDLTSHAIAAVKALATDAPPDLCAARTPSATAAAAATRNRTVSLPVNRRFTFADSRAGVVISATKCDDGDGNEVKRDMGSALRLRICHDCCGPGPAPAGRAFDMRVAPRAEAYRYRRRGNRMRTPQYDL
jgi:hypothetical protein